MTILCCKNVARKVPINYILLTVFTLCQAFFFAWVASQYTVESTLVAGGMTIAMTIAITVYAMRTKSDFTVCGSLFFVLSVGMIMFVTLGIFMGSSLGYWHRFISVIFVIIYGLYLIFDVQLIAGGRSHEISLDDYVIGALLLYVDIMMIFLELLKIFGSRK